MIRQVEIIILTDANAVIGSLEVGESNDFGLKLTKTVGSLRDISKRSGSYSLEFEVPNTQQNTRLLFGAANVNGEKSTLGQKKAIIKVDGNQIDKGYIYCSSSVYEESFNLFFKGGNIDWIEAIGDVELHELEWRDYLTTNYDIDALEFFSVIRINVLSSVDTYSSYDLTYPVVDRNNKEDYESRRPMIHFKAFWDAVANYTGFEFTGDFLNNNNWINGADIADSFSNPYKHVGLVLDPPFEFTLDESDIELTKIEYVLPDSSWDGSRKDFDATWNTNCANDGTIFGNVGDDVTTVIQRRFHGLRGYLTEDVRDDSLLYNPITNQYNVDASGIYEINLKLNLTWEFFIDVDNDWEYFQQGGNNFLAEPPSLVLHIVDNNTSQTSIDGNIIRSIIMTYENNTPHTEDLIASGRLADGYYQLNTRDFIQFVPFTAGQNIGFVLELLTDAKSGSFEFQEYETYAEKYWRARVLTQTQLNIQLKKQIELGQPFRINSHIPKGIKVIDIIKDFKAMFNLYFESDVRRKTVLVETRDNFYSPLSDAIDITDRIDLKKKPQINLETDYKKELAFNFVNDTENKYLKRWEKTFKRTYGEYSHYFSPANRFEKGTSLYNLNVFAQTIQGNIKGSQGDIITSLIRAEWKQSLNDELPIFDTYKPLLLQLVKGRQYNKANNLRITSSTTPVTVAITEPYANVPTFESRKLTFNGIGGLVYSYYLKTLASLNDFAEIKVSVKMGVYEFMNWDLKKPVYISEPAQIKGYYTLEIIENFDVVRDEFVTLTLQKTKDYTDANFDDEQGTNVDETIAPINEGEPVPILVEVNGLIVNCLDNQGNKIYKG